MMQKKIPTRFLLALTLYVGVIMPANWHFDSRDSMFRINPGATLVLNYPFTNYNGTLAKSEGATITGQNITFGQGVLKDANNRLCLSGVYDLSGTIELNGSHSLIAEYGQVLQGVTVSDSDNRIEGAPLFTSDITLQDSSTTLTLALQSVMGQDIIMNNSTVILEDNLIFADEKQFSGVGYIQVNGNRVALGGKDLTVTSTMIWMNPADITLNGNINLSGIYALTGEGRVNGNGNILDLSGGGTLIIGADAKIFLTDLVIKGLGSGGGTIVFNNAAAQLHMSNVTVELIGDVATSQGQFFVDGPTTWIVKDYTWMFDTNGALTIDGVTLWKDSAGQQVAGDIVFGSPESSFLTLVASGTIKSIGNDILIQNSLSALATSTGVLRSQLDECCTTLKTSTGALQSQIDTALYALGELSTSTGELKSQIDSLDVIELEELRTSTGQLQSQIDRVLTELSTNTTELQEQINGLGSISVITALQTSTGVLQSQISILDELIDGALVGVGLLGTSTGELQSQLDACCTGLKTSTGYLQSQIDYVLEELSTNTTELQEQIDGLGSISVITALQTSTGALQSQISMLDELIDDIALSVSTLRTSTGELQSQINAVNAGSSDLLLYLQTSTGQLQSQIDECLVLLKTSTGTLQSQIDEVWSIFERECCQVEQVFRTSELDDAEAVDWSHDSKYVAVGVGASALTIGGYVRIYERVGDTLVVRATYAASDFGNEREISVVRWHPTLVDGVYRLAVGRLGVNEDCDDPVAHPECHNLHVLAFDPSGPTVSLVSQGEFNSNVKALAWCPFVLSGTDYALAVARDKAESELAVYAVPSMLPALFSAPLVTSATSGTVQMQALDWDNAGLHLAVGVDGASLYGGLQVFIFNKSTPSLMRDASVNNAGLTASSLAWGRTQDCSDRLAAGFLGGPPAQLVKLFKYKTGILEQAAAISGISAPVRALDWNPNCTCLAVGTSGAPGVPGEFLIYGFDKCSFTASPISEFNNFLDTSVESVRWSPDNAYVINGSDMHRATLYKKLDCVEFFDFDSLFGLVCEVSGLQSCCDELKTSTGALQSQLDDPYTGMGSDMYIRTSTGALQSQIDAMMEYVSALATSTSTIETDMSYYQSQIDELKTSTGNLQSDITVIAAASDIVMCTHLIDGDVYFNSSMMPNAGQVAVFKFDTSCATSNRPRIIFDPTVYDSIGTGSGIISVPVNARILFTGDGIIECKDGVQFSLCGTPTDVTKSDWAEFVVEDQAIVHAADGATVVFGGADSGCAGRVIVRNTGRIILDEASQLIFGNRLDDALDLQAEFMGAVILDHSDALMTFQKGTFDIVFNYLSLLCVIDGVAELNTNNGLQAAGLINKVHFAQGSSLQVCKMDGAVGTLRMSPNAGDAHCEFINRTGVIYGGGHVQFVSFGASPVSSLVEIQENYFAEEGTVVEIFTELTHLSDTTLTMPGAKILVRIGSSNPALDGALGVLSPLGDGTIFALEEGDYNIAYSGMNVIGYDKNNRFFQIDQNGTRRLF